MGERNGRQKTAVVGKSGNGNRAVYTGFNLYTTPPAQRTMSKACT